MNKKILISALVGVAAVALLAGFGPGHAGPGFGHFDSKKAYRFLSFKVDNTLDDLKANDAQRKEVNALKDELFNEGMKLKEGQDAAHKELAAQWDAEKVDRARVHSLLDERIDAFRAFAHKAADSAIRLHDLLTPEQRSQLKALAAARHGAHAEP
jgi:periplasmic protein CpxP/Spy